MSGERERELEVEAVGESVGEAKWRALRVLEERFPDLDRDRVVFEVVRQGKRGLLGVGTTPACVRARLRPGDEAGGETALAQALRKVVVIIASALGAPCSVQVREDETSVAIALEGQGASRLIGRRGRTIDAVQLVVGAIAHRLQEEPRRVVTVDAGSYCARRRQRLTSLAERAAERARRTGEPVALEPMTQAERRIVHLALRGWKGIETRSEGEEPFRHVVVTPFPE